MAVSWRIVVVAADAAGAVRASAAEAAARDAAGLMGAFTGFLLGERDLTFSTRVAVKSKTPFSRIFTV
ncbi:hypothetical protein GCM10010177_77410 [Actinomadura citrea]|nr:hypothetical protein GCM10010177_77410 [Actinomadura citrea]